MLCCVNSENPFAIRNQIFITMKALANFYSMSDSSLETKTHSIISSLTENANYTTPVPALATVTTASQEYSQALIGAGTGNRADIATKNICRDALTLLLQQLCVYVNLTANGNAAKLLTSGFDVSKDPEPNVLTKPENLKVENGQTNGSLLISVKRVKAAKAYLHEYTTDATLAAGSWVSAASTTAKFTFINLQPATRYYCRVAAVGSNEQLLYSDTVSRIVV